MLVRTFKAAAVIEKQKQTNSYLRPAAVWALFVGIIIGVSSLVFWPISYVEDWHADELLTVMLVISFALITIGCHCFDLYEVRRRNVRN
jgi:hypothetical protein